MKLTTAGPTEGWRMSAGDFPYEGTESAQWKFLLRFAMLAPSSHNSQPWQFRLRNRQIELCADRSRACRVVDPRDRELIMSCGCALYHLRVAMRHFGCLGQVEVGPKSEDPDLVARVSLGTQAETSIAQTRVFEAIPRRRTNRQPFRDEPVPEAVLEALQAAAEEEATSLRFIHDQETKYAMAELISEGDRLQWADKAFRQELARWVHSNHSLTRDGIPGYAQGVDDLLSYAGPLVVRTFDMGDGQAAKDHKMATGSPILAVLSTRLDTPRDWVAAGQALASVLLHARANDLWASFLNQAIEVPHLRGQLRELLGETGFPQIILRLGFSDEVKPTPRREVDDVLV